METNHDGYSRASTTLKHKCGVCEKTFDDFQSLRSHRRCEHSTCKRFLEGTCQRSSEECWYVHESKETHAKSYQKMSNDSDFQFPQLDPFPPENINMIMKTLKTVLQKMEMMEEMIQVKQQK